MKTQSYPCTPESKVLPKQLLERFDDAANHFRKLMQRWDDRLTLKSGSHWEQYRCGRMALALDCDISGPVKSKVVGFGGNKRPDFPLGLFIVLKADVQGSKLHHWDDKLMLVHDIEVVQSPEGAIPSLIGFYVIRYELHKFPSSLVFECYASQYPCKYLSIPDDWKLRVFRKVPVSQEHRLPKKDIQGAPKIMHSISQNQRNPSFRRFALVDFDVQVAIPEIFLDADGIKINISKRRNPTLKVRDVLLGPLNL